MYEQQPYNPYRNNIAIVKEYFKSPAVLALAIMHIVSIIVSFIYSFISQDFIRDILHQLSSYVDKNLVLRNADNDFGNELMKGIRDGLASDTTFTFSIPVFTILTIIGLMLIYFVSRSEDPDKAPIGGVTILNILAILSLVACIIAFIAMLIVAVALFIVYATFKSQPSRTFYLRLGADRIHVDATLILILAIVFTVFVVISGIVILTYVASRKRFIGSVKQSLTSVELSNSGAKVFGVFSVIFAVFSVISLISSVAGLFIGNSSQEVMNKIEIRPPSDTLIVSIFAIISQVVNIVITVLQAKLALGYAKHIDEKRSGFNTPQEASGGFAPINAGVGVNTQPNPYSYLAQPQAQQPVKDDSFVNPYLAQDEKPVATTCPNCGAPTDGNAPFCGQCGTRL